MICDLGRNLLYSTVSKYADDTKNTTKIGNTDDSTNFQNELDNIVYPWTPNNVFTGVCTPKTTKKARHKNSY